MQLITVNDPNHSVLLTRATEVTFPLNAKTVQIFGDLELYVSNLQREQGLSGLAAPQVGFGLRIIFYHVKKEWSLYGREVYRDIPLTALFNPSYEPVVEEGMEKGFEGCFSVPDQVVEVYRYRTIRYQWQDFEGKKHVDTASAFEARILQHEIDHLDGVIHTTLMRDDCRSFTKDEYLVMRERLLKEAQEL